MKLVALYYAKTDSYVVVDHNLSDETAEQECQQLRADRFPAVTLTQMGKHRAKDAEDCKACARLIAEAREQKTG